MRVGDRVIVSPGCQKGDYFWATVTKVGLKYFYIKHLCRERVFWLIGNHEDGWPNSHIYMSYQELYDIKLRTHIKQLLNPRQNLYHYPDPSLENLKTIATALGILSLIEADIQTEIGHLETNTKDSQ